MKLVLNGTATSQYSEKSIEINGKPMQHILGVLSTNEGPLPITVWGGTKGKYWKEFASSGEPVSIVVEMFAKPQTYTNHEGETVTVPNLQLKLYSYLNMPTHQQQNNAAYNSFVAGSTDSFPELNNLPPPPPPCPPPTVGKVSRQTVAAWNYYKGKENN